MLCMERLLSASATSRREILNFLGALPAAATLCSAAGAFSGGYRGQSSLSVPLMHYFSQLFLGGSMSRVTLACFATGQVMKVLPPITAPSPITVSPPRMVALA